jgi:hypothetical protein
MPLLIELFWGMILAPSIGDSSEDFDQVVKHRCEKFQSGDWTFLYNQVIYRTLKEHEPSHPNTSTDPKDKVAKKAQYQIHRFGSVSAATKTIRTPIIAALTSTTASLLATFKSLHPQVGDPIDLPKEPELHYSKDHPFTELSTFESTHMEHRRPITDPEFTIPPPTTNPSISFTTEEYIKRVRRGDECKAAGLNGINYTILKMIFQSNDRLAQQYSTFLNDILNGSVTDEERAFLNASRGVGIPKNEDGDIRPLAIGHLLLRLLGSMALHKVSNDTQRYFQPLQFGVCVRNGCELMVNSIRGHLKLHPDHICISCDSKNAFNSFDRSKIWKPLRKHFPSLERLVRVAYGVAGSVIFEEDTRVEEIKSSIGSRQGCALGSFLYCLATHEDLINLKEAFPNLLIIAYCDDLHIVGPPKESIEAYRRWSYTLSTRLQGSLRDDKGCVYSTQYSHQQLKSWGCPTSMKFSDQGIKVLGAAIGNQSFVKSFLKSKIEDIYKDMDIISRMPSHHAQWAVTVKSVQQRFQYLFRCIPCGNRAVFNDLAAAYDKAILSTVQRMCESQQLSTRARSIARLPQNLGGLGIKSWFDTADPAYLASYLYSATVLPTIFPYLREAFHHPTTKQQPPSTNNHHPSHPIFIINNITTNIPSSSTEAIEACNRHDLITNNKTSYRIRNGHSLRQIQAHLSSEAYTIKQGDIISSLRQDSDPRSSQLLARFISATADQYTWSTTPTDCYTTMKNNILKIAALQRLLEPILPSSSTHSNNGPTFTCPKCNFTSESPDNNIPIASKFDIDPYGFHSIRCTGDGHAARTKEWHDRLRDIWYMLLKHAGYNVTKEPYGTVDSSQKRPDIIIHFEDPMYKLFLDIRTCDPLLKDIFPICCDTKGHAANLGVAAKDSAWLQLVHAQGDQFQAICHEHPGLINEGALALLKKAASRFGSTRQHSEAFKVYWLQRLHLANTIGTAEIIFQRLPITTESMLPNTCPHPPLNATLPLAHPNPHPIAPVIPVHQVQHDSLSSSLSSLSLSPLVSHPTV